MPQVAKVSLKATEKGAVHNRKAFILGMASIPGRKLVISPEIGGFIIPEKKKCGK